jgi:hypothetical protein
MLLLKKIVLLSFIPLLPLSCKKSDASANPVPIIITHPPVAVNYTNIINSESNFILAHQTGDGAFTMSADRGTQGYKIVPYFSNIAARALLENPTPAVIAAVKNWMTWYMAHLNTDGSVYDYYASNYTGSVTYNSTSDFDSIDSYAATFMTLAKRLCDVSPSDKTWLANNYSAQLILIGNALTLVRETDGLTIAKPSYQVEYTMDNSEVNEGMTDMVWLSQNVITGGDPAYWQTLLTSNTQAIETDLWNTSNSRYFMYKGGPVANWSTFYADATCQLYPIWCGVIQPDSQRAQALWHTFNASYPNWQTGQIYDTGGYPWTVLSYTAAVMNDKARADSYLGYVQTFIDEGKQPTTNWYNLEAAFVILAAKKMN